METTSTRLNAQLRAQLRTAVDQAVRERLGEPVEACPECGASIRELTRPVHGCTTCANRFWRRRQRARR
jgi:hypothetical protein